MLAPRIDGARVLDGYAGTGAVGIEALSRGAAHVTFVERDPRAAALIEANLAHCGISDRYAIIRARFAGTATAARIAASRSTSFCSIRRTARASCAAHRGRGGRSRRTALLVIEHARRDTAPESTGRWCGRATVDVRRQRAGVLQRRTGS